VPNIESRCNQLKLGHPQFKYEIAPKVVEACQFPTAEKFIRENVSYKFDLAVQFFLQ